MIWDTNLQNLAQSYADSCPPKSNNPNRNGAGENLYWLSWDSEPNDKDVADMSAAVQYWFDGVKNFDPQSITKYSYSYSSALYSQIIWASTNRIGCGSSYYRRENGIYSIILVCNYLEAANSVGSEVYKIGKPGEACIKKSTSFDALCANEASGSTKSTSNNVFSSFTRIKYDASRSIKSSVIARLLGFSPAK